MKIQKEETKISCSFSINLGNIVESYGCSRVRWLREFYLIEIAKDWSGWLVLYQDPADGRYWETYYESPETQGGGPVSLCNISPEDAKKKYNI